MCSGNKMPEIKSRDLHKTNGLKPNRKNERQRK